MISDLLIQTESGQLVPLSQIAEVKKVIGPLQINREKNQRRWMIQANVRGRDLGGVVSDIQRLIAKKVTLPPGYYIDYGGQFENQQRAMYGWFENKARIKYEQTKYYEKLGETT